MYFLTSTNDRINHEKCQQSLYLFSEFNDREMLLTNLPDGNDNNKENVNDLFDELALVNSFISVKKLIEGVYAKKAKYELTDQNSGTSNSVDSCSKNFAENANRSIEETDQQYGEKIQLELNQETDPLSSSPSATSIVVSSLHKFLKRVALKVYTKDQVFIIMRKGTFLD